MERQYSGVYWKIYDAVAQHHPRVISNRGSARSTKTYSILQFLDDVIPATDSAGDVTSVVSETLPHLKKGAIRDFENIVGHSLKGDGCWNESDHTYTYPNGAKMEFFSADTPSKVHGAQRKRLFVNECNHIPYEIYRQLAIRTSGLILLDYNPASEFWAMERVECLDTTTLIHSTYKDNPFLTDAQVREIESNRNDENWWRVYGLGLVGRNEGVIYDFEQIDALPDPAGYVETYGIDFGFTNDPTAIVHTLIDTGKKEIYTDEICYQRGLLNNEIASVMEDAGIPKQSVMIFADCAEPKTIAELCQYGWNVLPCYKATRKAEQVQMMRGYKHYITKRSINLIREHRGYVWAQTKDGNPLNEPIAFNDHAEDALRYSVVSYLTEYASAGQYSFGFGFDYNIFA